MNKLIYFFNIYSWFYSKTCKCEELNKKQELFKIFSLYFNDFPLSKHNS